MACEKKQFMLVCPYILFTLFTATSIRSFKVEKRRSSTQRQGPFATHSGKLMQKLSQEALEAKMVKS